MLLVITQEPSARAPGSAPQLRWPWYTVCAESSGLNLCVYRAARIMAWRRYRSAQPRQHAGRPAAPHAQDLDARPSASPAP